MTLVFQHLRYLLLLVCLLNHKEAQNFHHSSFHDLKDFEQIQQLRLTKAASICSINEVGLRIVPPEITTPALVISGLSLLLSS